MESTLQETATAMSLAVERVDEQAYWQGQYLGTWLVGLALLVAGAVFASIALARRIATHRCAAA